MAPGNGISDETRKDLAGIGHLDHAAAAADSGIYTPAMTEDVYSELARQTETLLTFGEPVVIDASFSNAAHRATIGDVARAHNARLVEIECRLDPNDAKQRVADRANDPSDATEDGA